MKFLNNNKIIIKRFNLKKILLNKIFIKIFLKEIL